MSQFAKILDRLGKIPRSQRLAVYGAIYVILVVAYWGLLYMPESGNLDTLAAERTQLTAERDKIALRVEKREEFKEELKELMADLQQALKELPEDREIPGLLKGISTLGKRVGLEVRRFQPLAEVVKEYYAEVPVSLEVEGSYHEVAMFFDRLSKMNRIVYVQDIQMGTPDDRGGKVFLRVTGKAVTFRFLSDEERARHSEEGKASKKGGRGGKAKAR